MSRIFGSPIYGNKHKSQIGLTAFLLTALLSGCWTKADNADWELSPEEKRNNFDACVIDYLTERYSPGAWDTFRPNAERDCVYNLR